MTKQIERQIRDLQKELDEFQELHAVLYLQPCNEANDPPERREAGRTRAADSFP